MSDESTRFKREILGVALLLSLASVYILYPFLDAIILAVATSYLLRFAHRKLDRQLQNEFLSSVIVISAVLGSLSLGVYFFINNFSFILGSVDALTGSLRLGIENTVEFFQLSENFSNALKDLVDTMSERFRSWLFDTFAGIPSLLIDLGIFMFASIFLYKDGVKIKSKIDEVVESLPENEKRIVKSLMRSLDSIFRGIFVTQFLVALLVGVITAIGFYLISLATSPMPLIPLWAFLIGVAALLPLVAAFMFYGPVGIYYMITGEPLKGSLIVVYGILVLNIVPEVLIRPYIGSKQMDEHPLIIFIGFLAGPLALGIKGLILGPTLLILTKEFVLNYADLVSFEPE